MTAFGKPEPFMQVDLPVPQGKVVSGRRLRPVVDVEVDQL